MAYIYKLKDYLFDFFGRPMVKFYPVRKQALSFGHPAQSLFGRVKNT